LLVVGTLGADEAFFLQGADGLSTDLHGDLFAIYNDGLGLKVRLPDFFGVALRETDIVAVLFAFTGEFAFLHIILRVLITKASRCYFTEKPLHSQAFAILGGRCLAD
jgi:hypothetical protein